MLSALEALGLVQTSNFWCTEPNVAKKYMKSLTYESIRQICIWVPSDLASRIERQKIDMIQTSNFSCTKSNALNKVIPTIQNVSSMCHTQNHSNNMVGADEGCCSSYLKTAKYTCLTCKEHFCTVWSVFEDDGWLQGSSVAYCEKNSDDRADDPGNRKRENTCTSTTEGTLKR